LTETSLENAHTCLSYTWGIDEPSQQIVVDNGKFLVRDNLYAFLQECVRRNDHIAIPLLIDAVCINQADLLEKNVQVSRMGKIYEQATEVIIWRGVGDPSVEVTFDHVRMHADSLLPDPDNEAARPGDSDPIGHPTKRYWDKFDTIASLPYWHRMWIVQELLLAEEVYLWYGNRTLYLPELSEYMSAINSCPGPPGSIEDIGNAKLARSSCGWLVIRRFVSYRRPGKLLDFQLAFTQLRRQLCYNLRDFVYALRALDEDLQTVPVEYENDLVFLMPKLFEQDIMKSEVSHAELLVLERSNLDVRAVINRTSSMLSDKTWDDTIDQIGVVTGLFQCPSTNTPRWTVNWSACQNWSKGLKQATYDDGIQDVELPPNKAAETTEFREDLYSTRICRGDIAIRFHWLSKFLIYRNSNQSPSPPEAPSPVSLLPSEAQLPAPTPTINVSTYTFHTALTIHPAHRHRTKSYLRSPSKHPDTAPLLITSSLAHNLHREL